MIEIIEDIKKLAHKAHYYCEDSWYSCPLAEDGCANDSKGKECDCGADATNEKLAVLFKQLNDLLEEKGKE